MTKLAKQSVGFDFINMLRGLAAVLVVYFHLDLFVLHNAAAEPFKPGTFNYIFIFGNFDLGKFAVGLFFIISGFLIPATLRRPSSTLRDFVIHRCFRLYPAYWVSILMTLAIVLVMHPSSPISAKVVLANVTMFQQFVGIENFNGAYWTLQIELIFYFICALLFVLHKLDRQREMIWLALAGGLACAAARRHFHREFPLAIFVALALMFLGDSIRAFSEAKLSRRELICSTLTVLAGLVPVCFIGYVGEGSRYVATYWVAVGAFLLSYRFDRVFREVRWIQLTGLFLADCSYSVYLLHSPIGAFLGLYLFSATHNGVLTVAVVLGSTIVAAYITYRLVEAPGIRVGRKLTPSNRKPTPLLAMAQT